MLRGMSNKQPTAADRGEEHRSRFGVTGGAFAVVALVLCCAGPALIAGGVIGAIGTAACNPLAIAFGLALMAAAVVVAPRRHTQRKMCCEQPTSTDVPEPRTPS